MTFIVVPHEIGTTTATVWIGAVHEGDVPYRPVQLTLSGVGNPVDLAGTTLHHRAHKSRS